MLNHLAVGLGEIVISRDPADVLVGYGLGSCLGIGFHDPATKVTGLLHAILPAHPGPDGATDASGKYVDRGIKNLLERMMRHGARSRGLVIRMAGGANMLVAPGYAQTMNIGQRNVEVALATLSELNLRVTSQEVGGNLGRTVRFYVADGKMMIRTAGNQEREV